MTFSKKGFQTGSVPKLFGNFLQIHTFHERDDVTEELKGRNTPKEMTVIKLSWLPPLKRGPEGDLAWGLRGHVGSQEPDTAVKGGVKSTSQCEVQLRVWGRNNGGRFLLESKPAASCDSGRAKQADGTVGFSRGGAAPSLPPKKAEQRQCGTLR